MPEEQNGGTATVDKTPALPGEDVTAGEIMKRVEDSTVVNRTTFDLIMSDDEIRRTWRTAAALAQSGMFKGADQAAQAFAKILIGRDLGISPTQALMTIDLVEGSIQMRGVLLAGFLRRHPTYDYRIDGVHDDTTCTVTIERKRDGEWRDVGSWTFTVEDARTAQLLNSDAKKAAWNAHRKNMLMWRAMANAVRAHAPDLFGGVPVYVDDEIAKRATLTEGVGDGSVQGLDLGPKVEAVLERAALLEHVGLSDRATAEMALGGKSPGDVERWCDEANAELDKLEADGEIADADVVDETPAVEHVVTVHNKVATCACGWESPTLHNNEQATEAGRAHVEKATAEPEPEQPAEDPVDAANRAEVLREQAAEMRATADEAEAEGHSDTAAEYRGVAEGLDAEAEAIADADQQSLL